jgi:hypothetical protein
MYGWKDNRNDYTIPFEYDSKGKFLSDLEYRTKEYQRIQEVIREANSFPMVLSQSDMDRFRKQLKDLHFIELPTFLGNGTIFRDDIEDLQVYELQEWFNEFKRTGRNV